MLACGLGPRSTKGDEVYSPTLFYVTTRLRGQRPVFRGRARIEERKNTGCNVRERRAFFLPTTGVVQLNPPSLSNLSEPSPQKAQTLLFYTKGGVVLEESGELLTLPANTEQERIIVSPPTYHRMDQYHQIGHHLRGMNRKMHATQHAHTSQIEGYTMTSHHMRTSIIFHLFVPCQRWSWVRASCHPRR